MSIDHFGMGQELLRFELISEKCYHSEKYSQNLYAALCDNFFWSLDSGPWGLGWKVAADLVCELHGLGDFYCSGRLGHEGFVPEGEVTDEVRSDLSMLGWSVV